MYLYLLKFKKGDMMKIGISNSLSDRLRTIERTYNDYGVDFENSILVKSNKDTIKILERQLLEDYNKYAINDDSLYGRDGYTELRDIKIFNDILDDINYKQNKFPDKNIKINKNISNFISSENINKKNVKKYSNKNNKVNDNTKVMSLDERSSKVTQHNYLLNSFSKEHFDTFDKQVIMKVLSMIHPDDIELKSVSINIDNLYEKFYGSKLKICPARDRMLKRLEYLKSKKIYVRRIDDSSKYISFPWFDKFEYDNKTRMAKVKINLKATDYLINLGNKSQSIKLDKYIDIDNIYAMRLMEIMSVIFGDVKYKKFEVHQLKKLLYLHGKYNKMYDFKKKIIEPAIEEINKYTDFNLKYEQIKVGREIKYIKFTKITKNHNTLNKYK